MSANLIAEALAAAEAATEESFRDASRYVAIPDGSHFLGLGGGFDDIAWAGARAVFEDLDHDVLMVRLDVAEAALKYLADRLERAEARIADLRAVASRMVCDSVQSYGVSDAFCACVTCQVKGYVGKEGEP